MLGWAAASIMRKVTLLPMPAALSCLHSSACLHSAMLKHALFKSLAAPAGLGRSGAATTTLGAVQRRWAGSQQVGEKDDRTKEAAEEALRATGAGERRRRRARLPLCCLQP